MKKNSIGQGVTKRCRLVCEPKCAGGGVGSQPMSIEHSCAHGAKINFGDLTPYLTYGISSGGNDVRAAITQ